MINYIDNAKIIPLSKLPKIGDIDNNFYNHKGVVCSINAYEQEQHPDYIFYRIYYSERLTPQNIKYYMFGVDTYCFEYAIKISDFIKED